MKKDFLDLSGIENSNNKIHIDDYVSQNVFKKSFIFLSFFEIYWYKNFPDISCFISLSFQDDEIGELATFSFHKYRKNEIVYDVENINSYSQPVYFEIFN